MFWFMVSLISACMWIIGYLLVDREAKESRIRALTNRCIHLDDQLHATRYEMSRASAHVGGGI